MRCMQNTLIAWQKAAAASYCQILPCTQIRIYMAMLTLPGEATEKKAVLIYLIQPVV